MYPTLATGIGRLCPAAQSLDIEGLSLQGEASASVERYPISVLSESVRIRYIQPKRDGYVSDRYMNWTILIDDAPIRDGDDDHRRARSWTTAEPIQPGALELEDSHHSARPSGSLRERFPDSIQRILSGWHPSNLHQTS